MSYQISAIDYETLAGSLLAIAKSHMRVDFDTDDEYIKVCITRAIDLFERFSGWRVFPATVVWTPEIAATGLAYMSPLQPVTSFVVKDGAGVDISAAYSLRSASPTDPVFIANTGGLPFPSGAVITLVVGFATKATLPPAALDAILRISATLYEFRESVVSSVDQMPGWMNDLLSGTWIPRA